MASGDNVDVIEVVETSFPGSAQPVVDHLRPDQSIIEEDCESPVLRDLCVSPLRMSAT